MENIIIVDRNDRPIGAKDRSQLVQDDIYRVSALHLVNSNGQILLARRGLGKKIEPGRWGPAVSGTVAEGETYQSNIKKEAEEEIGLVGVKFSTLQKTSPGEFGGNYFVQIFMAKVDKEAKEFSIQEEEVEELAWFTPQEIKDLINISPESFVASAPFWELAGLL